MMTVRTDTKISLRQTDVDGEDWATWEELPQAQGTQTLTEISDAIGDYAASYLALFERANIFYAPKEFVTTSTHFSDMARRCTAFYTSIQVDTNKAFDKTQNTWTIIPETADSWMCSYMWDSTMAKTPYCAGKWTSLECSGRGTCDKTSGTCECFDGYAGNDCAAVTQIA
jgi:hypothetical protein